MQEAKQSERDLVVLNIRLRLRAAPMGALLLLFALLPFLAGSASPAVSQQNVVLAAGTPEAVESAAAAIEAAHDHLSDQQDLVVSDAAARGGGQIVFPELALPGSPGAPGTTGAAAPAGVVVVGAAGPEFGSTLLAGSLAGSAGFIRPVNAPETSGFGPRIHPLLGRAMFHTGIDLGAGCRTPIRAAADGTVVYAATTPSWGNRIIIAHSATLKTAYGHQTQMLAKVGDVVKQGQVIGLVGTTGWSTGCHLHFDVILNNHYVDPAPYLGFGGTHAASIPFYAPAPGHSSTSPTTPAVKHTTPPVVDGDVPIPPAPATTTTSRPPSTTTTPPATTTTTTTTTSTTSPPTTTTTTTTPSTTTSTTPPATTTSSAASGTTTTTQCAATASDPVTPPAGGDVPATLPSCGDPASISAGTAAKSLASTTQPVLKTTSGVVSP